MIEEGKVSNLMATQRIFPKLLAEPERAPIEIAKALNLIQQSDVGVINDYIRQAIDKYPDKVMEYKNGKKV